jgi:hypothetical protein
VDADSALSVLENDILTDNKPATRVTVDGAAVLAEQPDNLVEDIEQFGKWAKKKKPTWEAATAFFPIVNWLKDYKVPFSYLRVQGVFFSFLFFW